jgi:hypothetical protein
MGDKVIRVAPLGVGLVSLLKWSDLLVPFPLLTYEGTEQALFMHWPSAGHLLVHLGLLQSYEI